MFNVYILSIPEMKPLEIDRHVLYMYTHISEIVYASRARIEIPITPMFAVLVLGCWLRDAICWVQYKATVCSAIAVVAFLPFYNRQRW